jgi:hypothetical protein
MLLASSAAQCGLEGLIMYLLSVECADGVVTWGGWAALTVMCWPAPSKPPAPLENKLFFQRFFRKEQGEKML